MRATLTQTVRLADVKVKPKEAARFLRVWLNRKLYWNIYLQKVRARFKTQVYALIMIAALAWGYTLLRAREVYIKVIRSVVAYRVSAYYTPTTRGGLA